MDGGDGEAARGGIRIRDAQRCAACGSGGGRARLCI